MSKLNFANIIEMKFLYLNLTKNYTACKGVDVRINYDNYYTLKHRFIGAN